MTRPLNFAGIPVDETAEEYWYRMARRNIVLRVGEEAAGEELCREIARRAVAKHAAGEVTCVWHELATIKKTRCYCQQCAPAVTSLRRGV